MILKGFLVLKWRTSSEKWGGARQRLTNKADRRKVNALEKRRSALIAVPRNLQGALCAQSLRQQSHETALNRSHLSLHVT